MRADFAGKTAAGRMAAVGNPGMDKIAVAGKHDSDDRYVFDSKGFNSTAA